MNVLTSLLPGLREARAPLISGYLWLLVIWLVFGSILPTRDTNDAYAHIWVVIDAIGPFGVTIVLSIVAYLLGSLIQSATQFVAIRQLGQWWHDGRYTGRRSGLDDYAKGGVISGPADLKLIHPNASWVPVAELPAVIVGDLTAHYKRSGDDRWTKAFDDVVFRELGEVWHRLALASRHALVVGGARARVLYEAEPGNDTVVTIPQPNEALVTFVIPQAFLGGLSLIQSRLLELAKGSGLQVEQFNAEAELREAVALAATAIVGVLSVQVGPAWLAALLVPLALLVQARSLRRHASWELIDALRAQAGTDELERITPLFARCRTQTNELTEAIETADWSLVPLARGDEAGASAAAAP